MGGGQPSELKFTAEICLICKGLDKYNPFTPLLGIFKMKLDMRECQMRDPKIHAVILLRIVCIH